MLVAFVDESYLLSEDTYVIAAVVCDGDQLSKLEHGLDELVSRMWQGFGVQHDAELHASEIFHGTKAWLPLNGHPLAQISVFESCFKCIHDSGARVITSSTRPQQLDKDPHSLCMEYLSEILQRIAVQNDDHLVVICDELDNPERYRYDLDIFRRSSTRGYKPTKITRIRDTLHFADSKHSRGLQAADMVAFLRRRLIRRLGNLSGESKANISAGSLEEQAVWDHLGGHVNNGGAIFQQKIWPH